MKKLFLIFAAIVSLSAVSCTSESLRKVPSGNLCERCFTISCPGTKADMDAALTILWENGDELSVYDPIEGVGRKFTVESVSEGKATIRGIISQGEFDFSAIYPYEVVSSWSGPSSYSINVPMAQSIATGKSVDSRALICGAFSVSPGSEITMDPLCSLVKFNISKKDISTVTLEVTPSAGGESECYTVSHEAGTFSEGDYYALVKPGSYEGGIKVTGHSRFDVDWIKSTFKRFAIAKGESINLGGVTDSGKKVHYTRGTEAIVEGLKPLLKGCRYYDMVADKLGTVTANLIVNTLTALFASDVRNDKVYTYNFNFTTAGVDGEPMTQSAKLYLPEDVVINGEKLRGVVLASRTTITRNEDCPSMRHQMEAMPAWNGYAVVMPDFYGFGADNAHYQAFINAPLVGRNNIDGLQAGIQLIADMGIPCEGLTINMGYSQGGMAAMANQRYVIDHPEDGIVFDKSFAGGGPYNFGLCYDEYITGAYPEASRFVINSLASVNESEGLGIDYSKLYKGKLLKNYREWVLGKKYDIFEMMDHVGSTDLPDFIADGILDKSSPESSIIISSIDRYSLVKEMMEIPDETELHLLHTTEDDYVPYENFTQLKEKLSGNNIHYYSDNYGGHIMAFIEFLKIFIMDIY